MKRTEASALFLTTETILIPRVRPQKYIGKRGLALFLKNILEYIEISGQMEPRFVP